MKPEIEQVLSYLDHNLEELWTLSLKIGEEPELAFEERKASSLLAAFLERRGFDVEIPYLDLPTSFLARKKGKKKGARIVFLAEYDALPEIGHACGHHLIAAMSAGAAIAISTQEFPGAVMVMGTPAEERGGGKVILTERGAFDEVDAALMVHPSDRTHIIPSTLALFNVGFDFKGKSSHASAFPEQGKNALDAAVTTYVSIGMLRQQLPLSVRVHGIFEEGGKAPNIIPEKARLHFFVRGADKMEAECTLEKVIQCAKGAAMSAGVEVDVRIDPVHYDPLLSNQSLAKTFAHHLDFLGETYHFYPPENEALGSSDIGNVSWRVPTIHPTLKIVEEGISCHTSAFAKAAHQPQAREKMLIGAKALAATGLQVLHNPSLMEEIHGEFLKATTRDRSYVGNISRRD